ncbi:hypothetical protein Sango_2889000 [Sesamum angolense]|uniref:RNase H type-1 domain-containing protein n=1 Tax=Sesamum angolense TaxID=2727404 RepID=A0AAE1T648_9LAMI|nr:hypothetical protein Sango_2889000 [Sesamum angolense]
MAQAKGPCSGPWRKISNEIIVTAATTQELKPKCTWSKRSRRGCCTVSSKAQNAARGLLHNIIKDIVKLCIVDFNLMVMICWTILWSWNLKLAQRISLFPFKSLALLEAIFSPSCRILRRVCLSKRNQTSWNPPPMNSIKINFYGGLLNRGGAVGLGIIARDTVGLCLAWSSLRLNRGGSVELAEALATREAIRLAHRFRWPRVILEGDCSTLVHKLYSVDLDFSTIGPIVSDIRFFSSFLDSISFFFVKRNDNLAADFLAGYALNQEGDASYLPPRLDVAIYGDLAY